MSTNSNFKKCPECNKFYDGGNNNFFLNLAISKFKNNNSISKELLEGLERNINKTSKIDWCTCIHEEKEELAIQVAANFDEIKQNSNDININDIGLDFTINQDILYIENNNFSEAHFLKYMKSIKQNLNNTIFDFDFLTNDKINDEVFKNSYKNYYVNPNFLLISELHQIKENNIEQLKQVISIIKERFSNNKKTFVLIKQDIELFKKTIKGNNWQKNELIYNELFELLENHFFKKLITVSSNGNTVVNTLDYDISVKNAKKRNVKKIDLTPKSKKDFDSFDT